MYAKKSMGMKAVVLLLAVVLVFGCAVGGTLAWLADKTDPVTNTFSAANISITLTETWNTDSDKDGENDAWTAKLVPGTDVAKDPKVTVEAGSEDCWVFVKVAESTITIDGQTKPFSDYIKYNVDLYDANNNTDGWKVLDAANHPGVYYREVAADDLIRSFYVLAGLTEPGADAGLANGYVHIPDTLTNDMAKALKDANVSPTLTFTAYAVQQEGFTEADAGKSGVARAWDEAKKLENQNSGN